MSIPPGTPTVTAASRSNRRLTLLFVAAVLLPCAVLVVLTLLAMRQDRELAAKRVTDRQFAMAAQATQVLRTRLDAIVTGALRARELSINGAKNRSGVVLVAELASGRPALPWQRGHWGSELKAASAELIRRAEQLEFQRGDAAAAATAWRRAIVEGDSPDRVAFARLGLARVLSKLGRAREARAALTALLHTPTTIADEHGVPFSLYAASALVRADQVAVGVRVDDLVEASCCWSPEALYMLRDVVAVVDSVQSLNGQASTESRRRNLTRAIERAEQATRLQRDFGTLGLDPTPPNQPIGPSRWVLYGQPGWLLTVAATGDHEANLLVAIDAAHVVESINGTSTQSGLHAGHLVFATPNDSTARSLAPDFAGIGLAFDTPGDGNLPLTSARFVYLGTLVLVVGVALFGAYFLSLDVRREMRLAEARSHFVASVSHELKTPLTAIRMFAETLADAKPRDEVTRREYLGTILGETERLSRLLDNVLDLSKIERGQKSYRLRPVRLGDVVERSARTLRYSIAQHGFHLRVDADDELPAVAVDEDAIEQAVLNLLTNAMKYSGESRDIDLRVHRSNGHAVIAVTDRGIGISRAHQSRVREKFFRAPVAENDGIPGTGLGLTLVDHIATAHGGRLDIESETGVGTTVSIHLPLAPVP